MQSFSSWQKLNPSTKIGRPPPNGKPGFNPDLILMDLDKLRASASYKSYFREAKLNKMIKTYMYHSSSDTPTLADMVNLMAVDNEGLFMNLGCEWNRNSKQVWDVLETKYNVCDAEFIHVWNGNPNLEKINKASTTGKSRTLVRTEEPRQVSHVQQQRF